MALEVIGAGLGITATFSLKFAHRCGRVSGYLMATDGDEEGAGAGGP